jgi:hypothetical protein
MYHGAAQTLSNITVALNETCTVYARSELRQFGDIRMNSRCDGDPAVA